MSKTTKIRLAIAALVAACAFPAYVLASVVLTGSAGTSIQATVTAPAAGDLVTGASIQVPFQSVINDLATIKGATTQQTIVNYVSSPYTWTMPTGINYASAVVDVLLVGGGGGGGSGAVCLTSSSNKCSGGAGGASGSVTHRMIPANYIGVGGTTVAVTVGGGGLGGSTVGAATSTAGNTGAQGGTTSFGTFLQAGGGYGGGGGQVSGSTQSAGPTQFGDFASCAGPIGLIDAGQQPSDCLGAPAPGGSGGGYNGLAAGCYPGGAGGITGGDVWPDAGAYGGIVPDAGGSGAVGGAGLAAPFFFGAGGGGGACNIVLYTAGAHQAGGSGSNYGGGGGGGGVGLTDGSGSGNAGPGGGGATGVAYIVVRSW